MQRLARLFGWALLAVASVPARALAQPQRDTVVMLVDSSVVPLSRRLKLEIEALGLVVKLAQSAVPAPSLEDEARAAGAVAAIRVASIGGGAVEMTILDRATGKTLSRKLVVAPTSDPAAAELIATRTVELLRASLMELAAPHPARGDVPITPKLQALAPPTTSDSTRLRERIGALSLLVGPALLYSANWRPGAHLFASLTWMPIYRLGVNAAVLIPLVPARLTSQEGHVDLFVTCYRLSGVFDVSDGAWPISLRLSAGLALARLRLNGTASSPYFGTGEERLTWSPTAGITARLPLARNLSVVSELLALVAYPRTVVRSAGREVSEWGRPAAAGTIGLELAWP
jgi:hypothetical protein